MHACSLTDWVVAYTSQRAEANQLLHTSEFLELKKYEAMLTNTKQIITGDAASALFAKILGSE